MLASQCGDFITWAGGSRPQPETSDRKGYAIRFDGDEVILQCKATPETNEQRLQDISESLRQRARAIADAGRDHFNRARSTDDAVSWTSGFDFGESEDEILAHTAAVAVGRKLLYHDEWAGYAEKIGKLIRRFLPPEVNVAVIDGHVCTFRPDSPAESPFRNTLPPTRAFPCACRKVFFDQNRGVPGHSLDHFPAETCHLACGHTSESGFPAPIRSGKTIPAVRMPIFYGPAGCCWEMQWRVPPSSTRSRQSMPRTSRPGNSSRIRPSAWSSLRGWRKVGTSTPPLTIRKLT